MVARATGAMSSITGTLSQVCDEVSPRAEAIAIERTMAPGERSLAARPSTRRLMNGSTIATLPAAASAETAPAQALSVSAVAGSSRLMRRSILPPSRPRRATDAAE